jgi:ribose transport system ATP-binding protein
MTPLVEIRGMSKLFPGTRALDDVDLNIQPGEVHGLVGQNGSGKSTLIKVLAGYHEAEPGTVVEVEGESVSLGNAGVARDAGFRFVHQDLALVDVLSVAENLALGRGFQTGVGKRIHWSAERTRANSMIRSLGFSFDAETLVRDLSAAERTGVAIARALWHWEEGAKLLVLDEPTAALPKTEVEILFDAIRRVRERGLGVIYVSHRLDEVFSIADRVTVLRDGRKVGTYPTHELDEDRLVSLMVGSAVTKAVNGHTRLTSEPALTVRALRGEVIENVGFDAYSGEVLGVSGLTGSGRDELLSLLFGSAPRDGEVNVEGRSVPPLHPRAAMDRGIAFVPGDRHRDGGMFDMSVLENCTIPDLRSFRSRSGALRKRREVAEVQAWLDRLDVRPPDPDLTLASLSGGNQQKVVLAKWLRLDPRVLLLDEPTQGVDVGAKATIHRLIRDAANAGAAVVIASSDDEEICDVCDRALVLRAGAIAADLTRERISMDELGRLQLSGSASPGHNGSGVLAGSAG